MSHVLPATNIEIMLVLYSKKFRDTKVDYARQRCRLLAGGGTKKGASIEILRTTEEVGIWYESIKYFRDLVFYLVSHRRVGGIRR